MLLEVVEMSALLSPTARRACSCGLYPASQAAGNTRGGWRGAGEKEKEKEALGLDSRQAVRITLPEGRHALCVSVRPGAQQRPLVACGSDDGTVVLLSFRQRSAVTEGAGASSSSVAADVVRVLRVAGGEDWCITLLGPEPSCGLRTGGGSTRRSAMG